MSAERLVGCRIVVRYLREPAADGPPQSDLVGELTAVEPDSITVDTRRGPVTVDRAAVLVLKPVAASRRDVLELERISRRGWRAAEQAELHGWLLYADHGWTGRANSVLPLRSPDRPLPELLDAARRYYAARGLPLQIQLPLPARDRLDGELAARHWPVERRSVVLTRSLLTGPVSALPAGYRFEAADRPDPDWLAGYHYRGGQLPEHAVQLLTRHDRVSFVSIRTADQLVAIGRGAADEGWLGVTAVEVAEPHRRRGLAAGLMRRLYDWGLGQGARRCYLQVDQSNTAALALYQQLGFTEHHRYHYRIEPDRAEAGATAASDRPAQRHQGWLDDQS
ncbi:MAG TPA: GNAT family N-acetyltransferase [Jatrophihabitans sp.]|nr:GNAT family N-acetyltransferase [Jatrophihabitans sp.]